MLADRLIVILGLAAFILGCMWSCDKGTSASEMSPNNSAATVPYQDALAGITH